MSKTLFLLPGLLLACGSEEEPKTNVSPEVTSFSIVPSEGITTSTTLYCVMNGTDADNDPLYLTYTWQDSYGSELGSETSLQLTPEIAQPEDEISCTATLSDGQAELISQTETVSVINTDPTIDSFDVNMEEARIGDVLVCTATASDADLEEVTLEFEWTNGETAIGSASELLLTADIVSQGDEVLCTVSATDESNGSITESTTVAIVNSPPVIGSIELTPSAPTSQDDLTCQVADVVDADGEDVSLAYSWTIDGESVTEAGTVLSGPFSVDASVTCSVAAQDASSETTASAAVTIQNTLPQIDAVGVTPNTGVEANTLLTCAGSASDVDGDTPAITYEWIDGSGVSLGSEATLQLDPSIVTVGEEVSCYITAVDANGGSKMDSAVVTVENTLPTIQSDASITPSTAFTSTNLTCAAGFEDLNDGTLTESYEWTDANGAVLSSSASYTISAADTDPGDDLTCVASATDANGSSVTSSASTTIENTLPTAPTVSILESTPYAEETDLTCTVDVESSDIDGQSLSYVFDWTDADGNSIQNSGTTTTLSNTLPSGLTAYGSLTCSAFATDGIDSSTSGTASVFVDYSSNMLTAGDLIITEVMNNPSTVDDADGEWFELYNTTANDINLLGLEIYDVQLEHTISESVVVPSNGYVVLGRNADLTTNGGVALDYEFASLLINNTTETLGIMNATQTLDEVAWIDGDLMPNTAGYSLTLSSDYLNDLDNDTNEFWCESITAMSNGEYGTPGSANENCDFDADTILASIDCDDTDSNLLSSIDDADCDGFTSADDCDDSDEDIYPGAGDTFGDWIDSDCDDYDCNAESTIHTSHIIFDGNLDSSTSPSSALSSFTMDGLTETIADLMALAVHTEVVAIDDDAGNQHDLTMLFEMTSTDEWDYYALVNAGELADPSMIGYAGGYAFVVFQGSLSFDGNGALQSSYQINTSLITNWYFENASPKDAVLDFGFDNTDTATDGLVTQTATASDLNSSANYYSVDCPDNVFICDGDADCDGVVTASDCDDTDDSSTTVATDGDCDGVVTASDCDDTTDSLGDIATDLDCNGILDVDENVATSWDYCPVTQTQDQAQYQFIGEAAEDKAGYSISTAGDVDNDGLDDILVGAYGNDEGGTSAGKTYLILGSSLINNYTIDLSMADYSFVGEGVNNESGLSVSTAGDVDNDGLDDILIGARWNSEAADSAGKTYLILGSSLGTNSTINLADADYSFLGENIYDYSGIYVSTAGDVDNDGLSDIVISANGNDDGGTGAGKAYLILGSSLGSTTSMSLANADYAFIGEQASDGVAKATTAGDVDNDGLDDILISANGNDDGGTDAGKSYLILGSSIGSTVSIDLANADYSFVGEGSYEYSGHDISTAGDVNNDGLDDILIGAFGNSQGGISAGKSYLILGSSLGSTSTINLSSANYSFIGEYAQDRSGTDVSSAGDVDNDGFSDILIGSHANSDGGSYAGKAYLILGSSIGSTSMINLSTADFSFIGTNADDVLREVSSAGDVNGDGQSDILIGAVNNDQGGSNAGTVGLFMACE